jgi:hypothetical protein
MLELMQRRGVLLARIAHERKQLDEIVTRTQKPLALLEKGLNAARFIRSHPLIPIGIILLFVIRRDGPVGAVRFGWRVWKGYRFVNGLYETILPRNPS